MRKILPISIAAALSASPFSARAEPAAPGSAQPAPSAAQPRGQGAATGRDRQICVSERLSGSRMPRRVCHTAREWELLHPDDSDDR